jgi:hypothetical protein
VTAKGGTVTTLEDVLGRLERDRDRHMLSPATEADLLAVEREVGPLPGPVRVLLQRLGGGILYERHELFGPRRLMIHDIELVPDLLSMRQRLRARPHGLPGHLLPVHRCEGTLHLVDLSPGATVAVVQEDGPGRWPDLASFLAQALWPSA